LGGCCGQCVSFAKDMVSEKIAQSQLSGAFHLATEIRL
jgi:bacterioferritin-associated ferredoxin